MDAERRSPRQREGLVFGRIRRLATGACVIALLVLGSGHPADAATRDRTAPTAPTNLRVVATAPYSVTLSWNASTDASGIASYTICCAHTNLATVIGSTTTFTFTAGLEASRSFSFVVTAKDNAGNASKPSNMVTVTTPPDRMAPSKPVVTLIDVGPTHVSLAWSAVDEGPLWFSVAINGQISSVYGSRATSATFAPLAPATAYTFIVAAVDFAHNISPISDPLTVTTTQADTTDTTAPTTPANFSASAFGEELWFSWSASTDNATPAALIEYQLYLNGVFQFSMAGMTSTVIYGIAGIRNTFELVAVDSAGNRSAPAVFVIDL
jgi:chitodextrinase